MWSSCWRRCDPPRRFLFFSAVLVQPPPLVNEARTFRNAIGTPGTGQKRTLGPGLNAAHLRLGLPLYLCVSLSAVSLAKRRDLSCAVRSRTARLFSSIPSMSFSIPCLVCLLLKDRFCSILVRIHITFLIRSKQGTAALANPSKNSGRSVPLTRWTNDCCLIAARRQFDVCFPESWHQICRP